MDKLLAAHRANSAQSKKHYSPDNPFAPKK
jgi:hypothetical protein